MSSIRLLISSASFVDSDDRFSMMILSVIIFAVKHGVHGLVASGYKPTEGGFVLLVGVLLFNYVGFELPSSAGGEMTDPQKDVPKSINM